jgi:hypothetical protein
MDEGLRGVSTRRTALSLAAGGLIAALPRSGKAHPFQPATGEGDDGRCVDRSAHAERRLHAYMDAFNSSDYALLQQYYSEDVVLVIGNGTELRGPGAVVEFYSQVKASTRRTIKILRTFPGDDGIAAELESEFLALEDVPDFTSGPMNKGDRLYINSFVIYETVEDRYSRIRAAVFKRIWRRV